MATQLELQSETQSTDELIRIRGANVHNLRDVDLDLLRNQMIVITGPSGSGKSTLAFDTLYAEGQRQYVESLSVYARQFLEQIQRPDVEEITGLPPTVCINQQTGQMNRRSTVATVTEIYDYLRLLMARCGTPMCYSCGQHIRQQNPEQIQDTLMELPEGTKLMLMAPMVRGRKGAHNDVFAKIRKAGFVRARIDDEIYDLEHLPKLSSKRAHDIEAVVDRVVIREGVRARIGESIRLALNHGEGLLVACYLKPGDHPKDNEPAKWTDDLFSTLYACPDCNISFEELETRTFSFNSPYGACPVCEGLGSADEFDPNVVIGDRDKSIADGAIHAWKNATESNLKKFKKQLNSFLEANSLDLETPLSKFTEDQFSQLLHGDEKDFLGILLLLEQEFSTTRSKKRQAELQNLRAEVTCRSCEGSRLRKEARNVIFHDASIDAIASKTVREAQDFFEEVAIEHAESLIAKPLVDEIQKRLTFLIKVGVEYLTLDRATGTLSGGELQRVRLATSIGSGLVGVCYILDEPSIGLHPRDNQRLIDSLTELQQLGNTVIIVEHDDAMMRQAHTIVDIGPGAGSLGGQIVSQGTPDEVSSDPNSVTGRFLSGVDSIPIPQNRRRVVKKRSISLEGATTNNLQNVNVQVPLGVFVCVTGVSGSGKSSLIEGTLAPAIKRRLTGLGTNAGAHTSLRGVNQIDKLIQIDQAPIGRTPRSNPATFTGIFDEIRRVFAGTRESRQRGFGIGRFSFNVKGGRCETCQGQGLQKIEMNFLPDLYVTCDTCHGTRFNRQTLRIKYRNQSIADVLNMSVDDGIEFFENFSNITRLLETLRDVGLGYLPLGQSSTTLSGGEAQRIKLATELARTETGKTLYLLDEPTTGLHFVDIHRLLTVLHQLVEKGNTVVVIEHNLDVMKSADWIIDLGPNGGINGGQIVGSGTPEQIAEIEASYTGMALKAALSV